MKKWVYTEAIAYFEKALEIRPDFYEALFNLGVALRCSGKCVEAEQRLQDALKAQPESAEVLCQLGLVLLAQGRTDEALDAANRSLEVAPRLVDAHLCRGIGLRYQGKLERAAACFDDALRLAPNHGEAHLNKAFVLLLQGDFQQGWNEYEGRWFTEETPKRSFHYPMWDGSPLSDRTILVYGEQGLGDEILFASCLPDVIARSAHCIIDCDSRLGPLFTRSFPEAVVHAAERTCDPAWLSELRPIDVQVAIGSLPGYFRNSLPDFPFHGGYLKADSVRVAYWCRRLHSVGAGLKIGISWRGGRTNTRTLVRSINLEKWLPVLRQKGTQFISLQYTDCHHELKELAEQHGIVVHHWQESISDYDETAALVSALDLIISVPTSVVSLAGALGKPLWVMVPSSPGWMFGAKGEHTPWFPSARLFRQPNLDQDEWQPVIECVAQELERVIDSQAILATCTPER